MQTITVERWIAAPVERCFLLSLSIDLHVESASATQERAVAGVTSGVIGAGERVTWRGRHFGFMLTHETVISRYERPSYFQDRMTRGAFKSFEHDHFFLPAKEGTTMRDVLRFEAPLGVLGRVAERLVLRRHLTWFLTERNAVIQQVAESEAQRWKKYIVA